MLLNQNYEPLTVCSWKKAVILLYLGKAELIERYDGRILRSVSTSLPMPSILRLSVFYRVPHKRVILSRKNILRRDGNKCQYCGRGDLPLTIDHVIPKTRGGEETWENLVCACMKCNNKKGDRTPEEAGLKLHSLPRRPNHVTFIRHFVGRIDEKWKPYLFMK